MAKKKTLLVPKTRQGLKPPVEKPSRRTEKQKETARKNISQWNEMRKKYGTKRAKEMMANRRKLRSLVKEIKKSPEAEASKQGQDTTPSVPKTGTAAHDLYKAIMDELPEDSRDNIRDYYMSGDVIDVGYEVISKKDLKSTDNLLDPEEFEKKIQEFAAKNIDFDSDEFDDLFGL